MSPLSISFVIFIGLFPSALAQSPVWGQCGGSTWNGPTSCVSAAVCTYNNPWYSQCLPSPSINYWFSFGDSYSQTGFNVTGPPPSSSNPIGNPDFPGWTATGGTNWVGYVTETYNNSLLYTYNYAYGGATVDAALVAPYEPSVLSLTDQVNEFITTVDTTQLGTIGWTSTNALFSIWIGVNDIGNSYYASGDRSAFSDTLLNAYFALVHRLYNAGGRNFLFANVPPIDRSPLMLTQDASAQALEKSVIDIFNIKLVEKINAFAANNTGVKTYLWDANAQFTTILDDPTSFGFQDATSFGSAANMFWGNNYHPSTYANRFFGKTVGQTVLVNTVW